MLGILSTEIRLYVIPEDGESLTAKLVNLLYFTVQQIYLSLVTVFDIKARRDPVEESNFVLLTGLDQVLDILALLLSVEFSPPGSVFGVILRGVPSVSFTL